MRIAGRLAGDGAQAEPLRRVERGALDAAIIERDALRLAVFEEQLAVVHPGKRLADDASRRGRIHAGSCEEQVVGYGKAGHRRTPRSRFWSSAEYGPPRRGAEGASALGASRSGLGCAGCAAACRNGLGGG
jgi:hypothetical protein